MRLLLFSDLHCSEKVAQNIVEMSREADIVVGAGDFGTMRKGVQEVIDVLSQIDRPTILVPGNNESYEELVEACEGWPTAEVLHGSGAVVKGIEFLGVGGGIPTTSHGSWSYDFTEEEARQLLTNCPQRAALVTHSPPKGVVDESSSGQRLGSVAVLETVERCNPVVVVCGHIHESWGRSETIGDSPVVNAGPDGVMWEVT